MHMITNTNLLTVVLEFLVVECDEWNACYLCTSIRFEEFTSNVVTDGNETQRYETVWVTPVLI